MWCVFCVLLYVMHCVSRACAKQKHIGYKKVQGQLEAALQVGQEVKKYF